MEALKNSRIRKIAASCMMLMVLLMIQSCNKSTYNNMTGMTGNNGNNGSGSPGTNEVFIQGMAFNPATITVTAGTTITWTNKDAIAHTVTSSTNVFSSGNMNTDATFSYTFTNAGTYSYYCAIHPSMVAKVVVN